MYKMWNNDTESRMQGVLVTNSKQKEGNSNLPHLRDLRLWSRKKRVKKKYKMGRLSDLVTAAHGGQFS